MKQLAIGTTTEYDLNAAALPGVLVRIDNTSTLWSESGVAHLVAVYLRVGKSANPLTAGANITVTPVVGPASASVRAVASHIKTVAAVTTIIIWVTDPVILTANEDTIKVYVHSDNASDTNVTVVATLMEVSNFDVNGRVDVGKNLGTAVTLGGAGSDKLDVNVNDWNDVDAKSSGSNYPQVDVFSVGDATPISRANIQTEVEEGLVAKYTQAIINNMKSFFKRF